LIEDELRDDLLLGLELALLSAQLLLLALHLVLDDAGIHSMVTDPPFRPAGRNPARSYRRRAKLSGSTLKLTPRNSSCLSSSEQVGEELRADTRSEPVRAAIERCTKRRPHGCG
jgi:hypothetical protein